MFTVPGGDDWLDDGDGILPKGERRRAAAIRSIRGRMRFLRERILVRGILAKYVGAAPADLQFTQDPRGKPHLGGAHRSQIEFSLSDSAGQVWIAVGRCGPLGLDIERIRPRADVERLAGRFFAPDEAAKLRALPAAARVDAFFRAWVQKEAYLKALGGGVPVRLPRFSVRIGGAPEVTRTEIEPAGRTRYRLYDLDAPAGHVAALAAPGAEHTIRSISHTPPAH